jgi:translation initiation factor IF-2
MEGRGLGRLGKAGGNATMKEEFVGTVTHYFGNIQVAAIMLEGELKPGDTVHIEGHTSDFTQTVKSMQLDRKDVEVGRKGQEIAIKVKEHARPNDAVYKVIE